MISKLAGVMHQNLINLGADIIFPNLGIEIQELRSVAFSLFGRLDVYWYGIIISCGIIAGLYMAMYNAGRENRDPEVYYELVFYALIFAFIGARAYYVIFSWDMYKDNLMEIINLRNGGLAIYGGVIGGIIAVYVFARIKKEKVLVLLDTAATGMILGQAIGRWGNFMNKEAFGGYTNNLFAMAIKSSEASYIPVDTIQIDGIAYLQVHPTFLYESLWNIGGLILMLVYFKKRKFDGEIFLLYLFGYGLGRSWIEGLRTDQLIIGNTGIPVSQLLAMILVAVSAIMIGIQRNKLRVRE